MKWKAIKAMLKREGIDDNTEIGSFSYDREVDEEGQGKSQLDLNVSFNLGGN